MTGPWSHFPSRFSQSSLLSEVMFYSLVNGDTWCRNKKSLRSGRIQLRELLIPLSFLITKKRKKERKDLLVVSCSIVKMALKRK